MRVTIRKRSHRSKKGMDDLACRDTVAQHENLSTTSSENFLKNIYIYIRNTAYGVCVCVVCMLQLIEKKNTDYNQYITGCQPKARRNIERERERETGFSYIIHYVKFAVSLSLSLRLYRFQKMFVKRDTLG